MTDKNRRDIVPINHSEEQNERPSTKSGSSKHGEISREARERSESGEPGGGAGRRDEVGPTGIYPYSAEERPAGDVELRPLGDWAGGDRGIAGYEDSGGSELSMREGELLGGLSSDASGRPTIDIHGGDAAQCEAEEAARRKGAKGRSEKKR